MVPTTTCDTARGIRGRLYKTGSILRIFGLHNTPLPSRPILSSPLSSPLEVAPLNPVRGLGNTVSSPAGSEAEPQPNFGFWCILALKSDNSFNDFPENQLSK